VADGAFGDAIDAIEGMMARSAPDCAGVRPMAEAINGTPSAAECGS
jgi:hypothetical protein